MLLRHSIQYLLVRAAPGLLNLAAIAIFTRLLSSEEFGRYAMVVAAASLLNVIFFRWLLLVLIRFLPANLDEPGRVKGPVLGLFLALGTSVLVFGIASASIFFNQGWTILISVGAFLTVAQAWMQLNLGVMSAQLQPREYGRLLGAQSAFSLILGGSLAWLGAGVIAPLIGLLFGSVLATVIFGRRNWAGAIPCWPSRQVSSEYSKYGVPLVITFALGWILTSSDRFLIAWLVGESATGMYSAGYDVVQSALGFGLAAVSTAAFPLALRAMESKGVSAAKNQLKQNGDLILSLSVAGAAGLIALGPDMVQIFIGEELRAGALSILPWIAVSAAVAGIKAFYLDVAFHLARQSRWLIISGLLAAIMNLALNMLLIPRFGIAGAAWSTLAAFSVAALASYVFGRRIFPMPEILPLFARAVLVAIPTYLGAIWVTRLELSSAATLLGGVIVGCGTFAFVAFFLDLAGIRRTFSRLVAKRMR